MPIPQLKALAMKTGKSMKEMEDLYDAAKQRVINQYGVTPEADRFYPLVMGLLKRSLGIQTAIKTRKNEGFQNMAASATLCDRIQEKLEEVGKTKAPETPGAFKGFHAALTGAGFKTTGLLKTATHNDRPHMEFTHPSGHSVEVMRTPNGIRAHTYDPMGRHNRSNRHASPTSVKFKAHLAKISGK